MCELNTALAIGSALVGSMQARSQANAMENSAEAAYASDKAALEQNAHEQGVKHRSDVLSNALAAMKRRSTASVAGAEAGVSPLAVINNEITQESISKGNIDYNYESGILQNRLQLQKAEVTRNSRVAQAKASKPGLLEMGLGIASAGVSGHRSHLQFLKAKEGI